MTHRVHSPENCNAKTFEVFMTMAQVDGDGAPAVQGSRMVARKSTTTNKKPEVQPVNR